jgi:hypothetical protein
MAFSILGRVSTIRSSAWLLSARGQSATRGELTASLSRLAYLGSFVCASTFRFSLLGHLEGDKGSIYWLIGRHPLAGCRRIMTILDGGKTKGPRRPTKRLARQRQRSCTKGRLSTVYSLGGVRIKRNTRNAPAPRELPVTTQHSTRSQCRGPGESPFFCFRLVGFCPDRSCLRDTRFALCADEQTPGSRG